MIITVQCFAKFNKNRMSMSHQILQHLSRLNRRFIHNYVTNDVPSHDAMLHPRFNYINAQGGRVDRSTYLKNWATGFNAIQVPYWDLRAEHIELHENIALVSAVNKYIECVNGERSEGMAAYTDVYVEVAGSWLCLHAQITVVAKAYWPTDETLICSYIDGLLHYSKP
jgi:hypothetical protein